MSTAQSAATTTTGGKERVTTMEQARMTDRPALTVTEIACILGVDYRTVSRAVDDGTIRGIRLGGRILVARRPFLALFGEDDERTAA